MTSAIKELTIKRTFDAPRELVWKAWTDPELIKQWFGPAGFMNPVAEVDARKGGAIHIVMEDSAGLIKKGSKYPMRGIFTEVAPGERLVFTNNAVDYTTDALLIESMTTVTLEKLGNKTKLTMHTAVTKVAPGMEQALAGMGAGWSQSFDKLKVLIGKI